MLPQGNATVMLQGLLPEHALAKVLPQGVPTPTDGHKDRCLFYVHACHLVLQCCLWSRSMPTAVIEDCCRLCVQKTGSVLLQVLPQGHLLLQLMLQGHGLLTHPDKHNKAEAIWFQALDIC